jgi:hypothetical protein
MYVTVRHCPNSLPVFRGLRNTSPLEACFLHYNASVHPTAKHMGTTTLHVRTNLFDWFWNTTALQTAGAIPAVGHSWLWLMDALRDVCADTELFALGAPLPRVLQHWPRTRTDFKPCTFRGVDWEMMRLRNASAQGRGSVSSLLFADSVKRVLEHPKLIVQNDWVGLYEATGVRTSARALARLLDKSVAAGLSYPHLEQNGLTHLRDLLRTTALNAPAAIHRPPLPLATVGASHSPHPMPVSHIGMPPASHGPFSITMQAPAHNNAASSAAAVANPPNQHLPALSKSAARKRKSRAARVEGLDEAALRDLRHDATVQRASRRRRQRQGEHADAAHGGGSMVVVASDRGALTGGTASANDGGTGNAPSGGRVAGGDSGGDGGGVSTSGGSGRSTLAGGGAAGIHSVGGIHKGGDGRGGRARSSGGGAASASATPP